jgi:hypothetical protein
MKKLLFILIISISLVLTSCGGNDDSEPQYYDLGVVTSVTNGLTIIDDDKDILYSNSVPTFDAYKPAVGDRLYFLYTMHKIGSASDAYDYLITAENARLIKVNPVIYINDVDRDTIGNANVGVSVAWVGRDYLNVDLYYYRTSKTHYFSLVYDPLNQNVSGATVLELRHKDYDDVQNNLTKGLISYDLRTLDISGTAPYKIVLKYKDFNNETKSVELSYTPDTDY